jgi:hypothetical protein
MRLNYRQVTTRQLFPQKTAFVVIAFAATNQLHSRTLERLSDRSEIERYGFTYRDAAASQLIRERRDFDACLLRCNYTHEVTIDAFQFMGELRNQFDAVNVSR